MVGADGATAAWVIAQHSDHDPAFQQRALELMRAAAAAGQADPIELAYLEDRTAVNHGRLASVGLEPLQEYLDSFPADMCVEGTAH